MPGGSKTFNLFDVFYANIGLKTENLETDSLGVYLSNEAPVAATDTAYRINGGADTGPEEIVAENGYAAGGEDISGLYSQSGGTGTLSGSDVEWTADADEDATGIGPFRYAVLYDTTTGNLIGWWDYGSAITLLEGEVFTVDFGASLFTLA